MMSVVLYHNHYDSDHLEKVKQIMLKRGTPTIKGFYDEGNGVWFAVEGCHRLRAAKELGLTPIMKNIANQKTFNLQYDNEVIKVKLDEEFFFNLINDNCRNHILDFVEDF